MTKLIAVSALGPDEEIVVKVEYESARSFVVRVLTRPSKKYDYIYIVIDEFEFGSDLGKALTKFRKIILDYENGNSDYL